MWLFKFLFLAVAVPLFFENESFLNFLRSDNLEEGRFRTAYELGPGSLSRRINEPQNLLNPYADGFSFDLYAYVSESATNFESEKNLVWVEKNLTYGSDSSFRELHTLLDASNVSWIPSPSYWADLNETLWFYRMSGTTAACTCTFIWPKAAFFPAHLKPVK